MSTTSRGPLIPDHAEPLVILADLLGFTPYRWADFSEVDRAPLSRLMRGLSDFAGDRIPLRLGHGAMKSENVSLVDVDQFYTSIGFRSILPRGFHHIEDR